MDKLVLRESGFMELVKNAANNWTQLNASSLLSLEDRLKLVASGDDIKPVHVYIQVESAMSSADSNSLPFYQAAACEAYNRIQERYDMRPDGAPVHLKMPLLPEYAALMKVKELVGELVRTQPALRQYRDLIEVLPLDTAKQSDKQIDIFVPYGTPVPEESRKLLGDIRITAQRVYAKILHSKGIYAKLPVVRNVTTTNKPYIKGSGGGSAAVK